MGRGGLNKYLSSQNNDFFLSITQVTCNWRKTLIFFVVFFFFLYVYILHTENNKHVAVSKNESGKYWVTSEGT